LQEINAGKLKEDKRQRYALTFFEDLRNQLISSHEWKEYSQKLARFMEENEDRSRQETREETLPDEENSFFSSFFLAPKPREQPTSKSYHTPQTPDW